MSNFAIGFDEDGAIIVTYEGIEILGDIQETVRRLASLLLIENNRVDPNRDLPKFKDIKCPLFEELKNLGEWKAKRTREEFLFNCIVNHSPDNCGSFENFVIDELVNTVDFDDEKYEHIKGTL